MIALKTESLTWEDTMRTAIMLACIADLAFIGFQIELRCFKTRKREIMRARTRWKLCLKKTEVHETWLPTN